MKKGIIAIAGGLLVSASIIGCGGDTTQLENDLKEAQQRTQFVADSIALEYQARVDSLQAVIDELTAANTTTPSTTTTSGTNTGSKPKTEEKKTEETTKGSKIGGGSDKQDESTQTKGSKISGGEDNQDKATDKKKSKMGNP